MLSGLHSTARQQAPAASQVTLTQFEALPLYVPPWVAQSVELIDEQEPSPRQQAPKPVQFAVAHWVSPPWNWPARAVQSVSVVSRQAPVEEAPGRFHSTISSSSTIP